jgi:hypothetical protein
LLGEKDGCLSLWIKDSICPFPLFSAQSINRRFQRLESHVVTLARSVAHLSSEMRTQHLMVQVSYTESIYYSGFHHPAQAIKWYPLLEEGTWRWKWEMRWRDVIRLQIKITICICPNPICISTMTRINDISKISYWIHHWIVPVSLNIEQWIL